MKRLLYIDCDGVTFDTESWAFRKMQEIGVDLTDSVAIRHFFATSDWSILFFLGGELNFSISKIKNLVDSNEFKNVFGLSTYSLYNAKELRSNEVEIKKFIYEKYLPFIKLITTPNTVPKHDCVKAKDNILVDNGLDNILGWVKNGGYGVYFVSNLKDMYPNCSNFIKPYQYGSNQPYYIIDDLSYLPDINKDIDNKEIETSYYGADFVIKNVVEKDLEDFLLSPEFKGLKNLPYFEKGDCYFDFDGVIVDLYGTSFLDISKKIQRIREHDIKMGREKNPKDYLLELVSRDGNPWRFVIDSYFKNVDFDNLLKRCNEIDNARQKIKEVKESNIFNNVGVASNVNSYFNEACSKREYLKEYDINLFAIPKKIKKSNGIPPISRRIVNNNEKEIKNILIDDTEAKVLDFIEKGGIGVLFLPYHKFTLPDESLNRPYYIIGDVRDVYRVKYLALYQEKCLKYSHQKRLVSN